MPSKSSFSGQGSKVPPPKSYKKWINRVVIDELNIIIISFLICPSFYLFPSLW